MADATVTVRVEVDAAKVEGLVETLKAVDELADGLERGEYVVNDPNLSDALSRVFAGYRRIGVVGREAFKVTT